MNIVEALQALKDGEKVRHVDEEKSKPLFITENGFLLAPFNDNIAWIRLIDIEDIFYSEYCCGDDLEIFNLMIKDIYYQKWIVIKNVIYNECLTQEKLLRAYVAEHKNQQSH